MNDVVFYNMGVMAYWWDYIGIPCSVEEAINIAANDAYFLRHINEYAKHYELTPDNACVALWCCEKDYAYRRGDVHQKTFYKVWLEHTAFICDGVTGYEWIVAWCKDCLNELNGGSRSNKCLEHFSARWSYEQANRILKALQNEGFISTNTTIDVFYYRMTGNGRANRGRICWVRTAKNKAINLVSLIDFITSSGINLEDALSLVGFVFCRDGGDDINLPDDTKSKARQRNREHQDLSKDHQKIAEIIGET